MIITKEQFKLLYPSIVIDDLKLEALICAVEKQMLSHSCSDSLEFEANAIELHRGNDSRRLWLCKPVVKTVNSVKVNGKLLDPENYIVKKQYIELYEGVFPMGMDIFDNTVESYSRTSKILIDLDGGYIYPDIANNIVGNVPCNLVNAIAGIVKALIDHGENGGLSSYKISDISYSFKSIKEQTEHLWFIIKNYI